MDKFKQWMICLDLTSMDEFLLGYVNYLAKELKPEKLTFLHIMEETIDPGEIADLFPDTEKPQNIKEIIKEEIKENIQKHIDPEAEWSIAVEEGTATGTIIRMMDRYDPDLFILGKKYGYKGEGIIAQKVVKYVPCSALFVPETSRYKLDNLLIPFDFTKNSALALAWSHTFAKRVNASVKAQHVYSYPVQAFPTLPTEGYEEKMTNHLEKKLQKFKVEHPIHEEIEFIFTLRKNKKHLDIIYDQSVKDQTDMILAGARTKSTIANVLMDDMADRMIHYAFGIPLLIIKNKREYKGLIKALIEK